MENLVSQGLPLALIGIGIVFFFLCLLISATRAMSFLAARLGQASGKAPANQIHHPVPPAQMAAVIAAVTMHRSRLRARRAAH